MEVQEIFDNLAEHMLKGMMIHENLANYYDFLGLRGYKRCHEYHFLEETKNYRKICRYYINHYSRLIHEPEFSAPDVIPESWYSHIREDVDISTKKNAVKNGLMIWKQWEKETKTFYQNMYKELLERNEVASANKINELVCDVDEELKEVQRYLLNKEAINYDMSVIVEEQKYKHDKYKKKMKCLWTC